MSKYIDDYHLAEFERDINFQNKFIRFTEEDFQFIEKFLRDNAKSLNEKTIAQFDISKFARFAVEFDRMEVINLFFNEDEDIFDANSRSILAGEVLSQAARFYKMDLIDKILGKGFDIDQLNIRRETALYSAAIFRQPNSIRYLCDKGAKVDFEVEIGPKKHLTPLHMAAMDGKPDIIRTLIECGADVNYKIGLSEITPIKAAIEEFERSRKNLDNIKTLIECGADVNAGVYDKGQVESTLLCHAIEKENIIGIRSLEAAKLLIGARNIDVNKPDIRGFTPLHWAAMHAKNLIGPILLKGAKVNVTNDDHCTPLHLLAYNNISFITSGEPDKDKEMQDEIYQQETQDALNAVILLLEAGADVTIRNEDGQTAIDIARERLDELKEHNEGEASRPYIRSMEEIIELLAQKEREIVGGERVYPAQQEASGSGVHGGTPSSAPQSTGISARVSESAPSKGKN